MATVRVLGLGNVDFPDDMSKDEIAAAVKEYKAQNKSLRIPEDSPYVSKVQKMAAERGLDPDLMLRMVAKESGFDPMATSKRGAGGLLQLMPNTAKEVGIKNVYDPDENLRGGMDYFARMVKAHDGDVRKALIAYNWGPGNLAKHGDEKLPAETQNYVRDLLVTAPGTAGPAPQPNAQAASVAGLEGVKGVANSRAGQPEASVSAAPEAKYPGHGFVSGMGSTLYRTGRALGLPQALDAMGLMSRSPQDVQLEYDVEANQLGGGTTGRVTAGVLQSAIPARAATAISKAPYVAGALGGAIEGAAFTPGDPGDRLKAGGLDALLSLPLTAAARGVAKPFSMNPEAQLLRDQFGVDELPPMSIGSGSRVMRNAGELVQDIPGLGNPQRRAGLNFENAVLSKLWQRATPPGMPNMLDDHIKAGGKGIEAGQLFDNLKIQQDLAYQQLLSKVRVPVTTRDLFAMQSTMNNLPPNEAAKVGQIFMAEIGYGTGLAQGGRSTQLTGSQWKAIKDNLQHYVTNARSTPSGERIADEIQGVIQAWDGLFNARTTRAVQGRLTALDEMAKYRSILENSVKEVGQGTATPRSIGQSIANATPQEELIRGRGLGQDIMDPLLRMDTSSLREKTTVQNQLRRMYPWMASAAIAGGTGTLPHATALTLGIGTTAGLSGYRPVAKLLYGETGKQQALAELLRKYPGFTGALEASMRRKEEENAP